MKYAKILGTGSFLPKKILTNYDLEKMVDTSNEWIIERTGIKQRHIAEEDEDALTMAEAAGYSALKAAGLSVKDIQMIIVASTTPSLVFPGTACLLQERYGIAGCAAFDLNASACAGFMYAFSIADQYIKTGSIENALIIGSEVMSRVVDWKDRATCVLFGDGAGAVVLGVSDVPGILSTHLHADGTHKDVLYLPFAPTHQKPTHQKKTNAGVVQMQGNQLFKLAVTILGESFDETLVANQMQKSQVDWLIPHQANIRIIQSMAKKLELPLDRVAITLEEQGNTSSASIPLALDKAIRDKRITRGQILMMEGFGGGLSWGSALVRY